AGTKFFKDLVPEPDNSDIYSSIIYSRYVFFTAFSGNLGGQLWVSNGTDTGTVIIKPPYIPAQTNSINYEQLCVHDSTLYVCANYDGAGHELWAIKDTTNYTGIKNVDHNIQL